MEGIEKYKHTEIVRRPNYLLIPCSIIPMTDEGAHEFNRILSIVDNLDEKGYSKITRTRSGGISVDKWSTLPPYYDVRVIKSCTEITIVDIDGMWRLQFRTGLNKAKNDGISGHQSWIKFVNVLSKDFGIDIHDFAIENGEEIKSQIPRAIIGTTDFCKIDKTYKMVHHIDLNSSHPSGMAEAFPQLREPIEYMYLRRKSVPIYKAILTHVWGYMQSSQTGYKYSHISKAGIEYTNRRVRELEQRIIENGGLPLLINTDGIWYQGEVYHAADEGNDLGQWKNDYVNVQFRAKSNGCYEFIDVSGKYHPVLRGYTKLDMLKDRDQWEWGDIYNTDAEPIKYGYHHELNRIINDKGEIL